jgi:nucleotide-binding universal stress UspA family protein
MHVLIPIEEKVKQAAHPSHNTEQEELEWLRSLNQSFLDAGLKAEITQLQGDVGRIICQVAEDWSADVIALGRRGRSGMGELFLGSVSNYVLHHAPCSVLTVQGKSVRTQDEELQHYLDTF